MTYIAFDSYMNPFHKDREQAFTSKVCFIFFEFLLLFGSLQIYPELQGCQSMYMLPLMSGAVEYLSGKPRPHGTLLGLIPPTAVCFFFLSFFFLLSRLCVFQAFVTVKGFGMKWPWKENLTEFEKKLNSQ